MVHKFKTKKAHRLMLITCILGVRQSSKGTFNETNSYNKSRILIKLIKTKPLSTCRKEGFVHSAGVEPTSSEPESDILSIELRVSIEYRKDTT